jgi:hypothetical protein
MKKYRAEVCAVNENVWSSNAMEYNSPSQAYEWLDGLRNRWFGYNLSRVVSSDTPRNQPLDLEKDVIYQNYRG